jgi:hypothetical protein
LKPKNHCPTLNSDGIRAQVVVRVVSATDFWSVARLAVVHFRLNVVVGLLQRAFRVVCAHVLETEMNEAIMQISAINQR